MNEFDGTTEIVVTQPTEQAVFSKTTQANLFLTQQALEKTKESMIRDMSRQRMDPETMLKQIVELQDVQVQLDTVGEKIQTNAATEYTEHDVGTMRDMKKTMTEVEIAQAFGTNQSKVNRLLNPPRG